MTLTAQETVKSMDHDEHSRPKGLRAVIVQDYHQGLNQLGVFAHGFGDGS